MYVAYSIFAHLFLSRSPDGFTALISVVTLLAGVQLVFLGLIGEYVGRIFQQVKLRPMYVVDRVLEADNFRIDDIESNQNSIQTATLNAEPTAGSPIGVDENQQAVVK